MTTAGAWPDVWPHEDRPMTVGDMENMPDDDNRYELDEGILIVSPAPFNPHQFVVTRLTLILGLACPAEFIVLAGPGLNLSQTQHRVPDIGVVLADGFRMEYVFESRPPLLVVEVASRSTALYDRTRKKAIYEQYGIPSYWIVGPDPDKPALTCFELSGGRYQEVAHVTGDEVFETVTPFPVSFAPSRLMTPGPLH
ncbi:MAG TPA: Uma2 family endonuclease [Streptosporangiaceae bacterium]|nr:Uma2 family endonuclease [Streptosporangiaceae bacterium]